MKTAEIIESELLKLSKQLTTQLIETTEIQPDFLGGDRWAELLLRTAATASCQSSNHFVQRCGFNIIMCLRNLPNSTNLK